MFKRFKKNARTHTYTLLCPYPHVHKLMWSVVKMKETQEADEKKNVEKSDRRWFRIEKSNKSQLLIRRRSVLDSIFFSLSNSISVIPLFHAFFYSFTWNAREAFFCTRLKAITLLFFYEWN